jgi:hypothetical protein
MAKLHKNFEAREKTYKKSSLGNKKRSVKFSSMNKSKKRSWKAYNGQGK